MAHSLFRVTFLLSLVGAMAQIPDAPSRPNCPTLGSCRFKPQMSGTPTSVVGHRVVLFDRSVTGGHAVSRQNLRTRLTTLSVRFGFDLVMTADTNFFSDSSLADAKVVILAYGDGDALPAGKRSVLENFVLQNGWGIILVHSACAFVTNSWPFRRAACLSSGGSGAAVATRPIFVDSGTASSPNHGRNSPYSDFLLRKPIGTWDTALTNSLTDEWTATPDTYRDSAGVNFLFRSSTLLTGGNTVAFTRLLGNGLSVFQHWGNENNIWTQAGGFGDTLLWRFMRYVAKDWEQSPVSVVSKSHEPIQFRFNSSLLEINMQSAYFVEAITAGGQRIWSAKGEGSKMYDLSHIARGITFIQIRSGRYAKVNTVRGVLLR